MKGNNITGIVALYDFEPLDYIPYKESIISSFNIADKVMVVYGGSIRKDCKTPVLDELKKMTQCYNIIIKYFNWPKDFNWTQFCKNYSYGRYFIKSKWGMFFTCDEIFPDNLRIIKSIIKILPPICRLYFLNKSISSE